MYTISHKQFFSNNNNEKKKQELDGPCTSRRYILEIVSFENRSISEKEKKNFLLYKTYALLSVKFFRFNGKRIILCVTTDTHTHHMYIICLVQVFYFFSTTYVFFRLNGKMHLFLIGCSAWRTCRIL